GPGGRPWRDSAELCAGGGGGGLSFPECSVSSAGGRLLCLESGCAPPSRGRGRGAPAPGLGAAPGSGRRAFGVSLGRGLWLEPEPSAGGVAAIVRFGAGTIRAAADGVASRSALSPCARNAAAKSSGVRCATPV